MVHDGEIVGVCLKRINDVLVTRHLIGEIKCVVPFSFMVLGNGRDFIGKRGSCQNGATAVPSLRIKGAGARSLWIF